MNDFLSREYFGNNVLAYIIALAVFFGSLILITFFRKTILSKLKKASEKSKTTIDDFIISGVEKTIIPLIYFWAFYAAVRTLVIDPRLIKIIDILAVVITTYFIVRIILSTLKYSIQAYFIRRGGGEGVTKQIGGIMTLISLVVWGLAVVFLLDNMGFKVSAVIAGLGIGGIAIALAAQTVLGDLFSYFVILFDKPFEVGDFINVGDKLGSVEYVGIKTTRVRALSGEQLVFSNTDLTNARLHNYKRMERRRVLFKIGVLYETGYEQIKEIPNIIKNIIEDTPDTTFDRSHFLEYGNFSLNYETVYYVNSPDYNKYADIHQSINFRLFKEFESRGIVFAYPTQTLYVNKVNGNEPKTELV